MKKFFTLTAMLCLTAMLQSNAQDVHFSQFFEAPLVRNPSLAGIFDGDVRVQGVYRSQWGSVTVPFVTQSINAEYKMPVGQSNDFVTLGMQILHDKAGTTALTTTNVYPALNYHKALSADKSTYLSMGFMGGLVQRSFDRSKVTTNHTYDNGVDGEGNLNPRYGYLDGSAGMSFNSTIGYDEKTTYFVGLAYHHFNQPKASFYSNPAVAIKPKWVASGGIKFPVDETSYFTLEADYTSQNTASEIVAGGMYSRKIGDDYDNPLYTIHFGGYMRLNDAFIPVVKLDYHPFSVAISYDINVSTLKTVSQYRGGVELSIAYVGFLDRDNSSKNAVMCPHF
ncbi:type IX secretion system membrane protein PorP/SprF [Ilyomonas limi]|uniref:Type IX secretion system membrane protein PorP/SprF n=1 Tax=Ilyomonas limi TaxID=2575867 RepID=A0A4U3L0T3_9BACT|nr:PorP/SprF family type IX secretion system membrane protein [Ilyomonas limi]TKK67809.1 type IX secretion system membrane protein PorP/SprF [Ilyomonas limi]